MAGLLATVAKDFGGLPCTVVRAIQSFLELFEGVPASVAVMEELLSEPLQPVTLAVHSLDASTRLLLEWRISQPQRVRGSWVRSIQVRVSSQAGDDGPRLPVTEGWFDHRPDGMRLALAYAKSTWARCKLGACESCLPGLRLRLVSSGQCVGCTLRSAILDGLPSERVLRELLEGDLMAWTVAEHPLDGPARVELELFSRSRGRQPEVIAVCVRWRAGRLIDNMAQKEFDRTLDGLARALVYGQSIWRRARAGPCDSCEPGRKRLRLLCSGFCNVCTVRRAVL